MHIAVTFPKGTLWRSGVSLQNITSITPHLHLYIGRDRASQTEDCSSQAKSSVDFLPLCRAIESKVGDYPSSYVRKSSLDQDDWDRSGLCLDLQHLENIFSPICYRSRYYAETPAYVSFCNSKNGFQLLRVTDRDVTCQPVLISQSVTA